MADSGKVKVSFEQIEDKQVCVGNVEKRADRNFDSCCVMIETR